MPFGVGVWEMAILALVIVLLFGSAKLPTIARQLGRQTRTVGREVAEMKNAFSVELTDDSDAEDESADGAEQLALPKPPKPKVKRAAARRR